jgi:hypothetical protein
MEGYYTIKEYFTKRMAIEIKTTFPGDNTVSLMGTPEDVTLGLVCQKTGRRFSFAKVKKALSWDGSTGAVNLSLRAERETSEKLDQICFSAQIWTPE